MGLFKKKLNIDDVLNVVILEKTQNYTRNINRGFIYNDSMVIPDSVYINTVSEPAGCTYTFSVIFKDGRKEIVKADSGTPLCDALLQKAIDAETTAASPGSDKVQDIEKAPVLQKNQLPQGIYKIGRDIPPGTYDLHLIWGSGRIEVYKAEQTILGNLSFSEWMGTLHDYEKQHCINIQCENGWFLHVRGNIIVGIARSANVQIDL